MKHKRLDLKLFDGDAGAAAAASGNPSPAGNPAPAEETAKSNGTEQNQGNNAAQKGNETPNAPDLNKKVEELISGEYRDQYEGHIKKLMGESRKAQNAQKQQLDDANAVLQLIGSRYGISNGNAKDIMSALENDTAYWEEAAAKEGLSVEQYKYMKKIESQNRVFREQAENTQKELNRQRMFAKWDQEAKELQQYYPNFSLAAEMQNPDFQRLMGAGIDMKTIYEVLHNDEILSGAMQYTAQKVAKRQVDAIRSTQNRPQEAAAQTSSGFKFSKDVSKMTDEEILEYGRKAKLGELINNF